MSAQHTPGPWSVDPVISKGGRNKLAVSHDGRRLCDVTIHDDETDALLRDAVRHLNAHDDLLAALDRIDCLMRDCLLGPTPTANDVQVAAILVAQSNLRAAIAKARGRA